MGEANQLHVAFETISPIVRIVHHLSLSLSLFRGMEMIALLHKFATNVHRGHRF